MADIDQMATSAVSVIVPFPVFINIIIEFLPIRATPVPMVDLLKSKKSDTFVVWKAASLTKYRNK